jgi:hypothetical protein
MKPYDLISRKTAIIQLSNNKCGIDEWDIAVQHDIETIKSLASAQAEIIRCGDCKFAHITNDRRYCKFCDMFTDDYGQLIEMYFDSNFYCGYAERRIEE